MSKNYEDLIKNARMNAECGEHMSPAEVTTLLNVVETTLSALAAENAGLKGAIVEHSQCFTVCKCCGTENDCSHDDVCRALNETPATDAFLAEVRAQGVEQLALHMELNGYSNEAAGAREYAANLRKGVQS
ncbi:hypothetical protein L8Q48_02855 [Enterobacter roggenkampii]|uniref:hypothetical protein n=1 Tax=Enterobacter roggenkampii TaxID=1812935 RepID=UPI0020055CD3|nr:hypothetical protein [Enterobacter roggenkampii]MCK6926182.1 hypothetical protein [Enterobacter roggenkampii]